MKFYHEHLQDQIKSYKRQIEVAEKKLKDPSSDFHKNILFEIAQYWDSTGLGFTGGFYTPAKVDLYLSNPISIEQWEQIYQDIDDILLPRGYELDIEYGSMRSTSIEICYKKEDCEDIKIEFNSTSCEKIPTGKMVPEYKNECGFVKTGD